MKNFTDRVRQRITTGMSRRRFLEATALGVAGISVASFPSSQTHAAMPKRGGHLRLGSSQGSTTDVLDPSQLTSGFTQLLFYTYLSQLTEIAANGQLVPSLAESWSPSVDAKIWTFELRKDVEFHNGKTFDAEDVIATMALHRGEDSTSAMKSFADQIESITTDGPNRVSFQLKEGNADFPYILSSNIFGILPAKDGKPDVSQPIGTGSYVIETFDPGVRATLRRNPNYFRDDVAFFDTAEVLVIADTGARQSALVTGEVDLIDRVDPKTALLLEQNPDVDVLDLASGWHFDFPMRTDTTPFDNNDVRLALKYAIDREAMVRTILSGYGTVGNDHPISPSYRYYASDIPQRIYDPEKAKFHLNKAGLTNLDVSLSVSESLFPGAVDMVVLYREHAAKTGISIKVNRVPNDGYWSDVWMKHAWSTSNWTARPTEDWMFTQAYAEDSSWNETYWRNARFNTILKAARAELDEEKRREMYKEMQQLVRDDGGAVIPIFANHVMGVSKRLAHQENVAGNFELDGYKAIERWWLAG